MQFPILDVPLNPRRVEMGMNRCEQKKPGYWRKRYESGAVPQDQNVGKIVDAIGEHYAGPAEGLATLTLARNPGQCSNFDAILVPIGKYELGQKLNKIPGNAIPLEVVFPDTAS